MTKYRLGFRGFGYIFRKHWYSFYRWKNPSEYDGARFRIIDFGMLYFSEYKELLK